MREKIKNVRQSDGFTIIEVLIVLAIAGLIMLIVFLAVPALQRNSRNTQRKNDASAMLTAVTEFTGNNNGIPPSTSAHRDALLNLVPSAKRAYYKTDANITLGTSATTPVTNPENMVIIVGRKCDASTVGAHQAGTPRSIVLLYAVENSSGATGPTSGQSQCIESGV